MLSNHQMQFPFYQLVRSRAASFFRNCNFVKLSSFFYKHQNQLFQSRFFQKSKSNQKYWFCTFHIFQYNYISIHIFFNWYKNKNPNSLQISEFSFFNLLSGQLMSRYFINQFPWGILLFLAYFMWPSDYVVSFHITSPKSVL